MKLSEAVEWCRVNDARITCYAQRRKQAFMVSAYVPGKGFRSSVTGQGPTLVRAVISARRSMGRQGRCDGCGRVR